MAYWDKKFEVHYALSDMYIMFITSPRTPHPDVSYFLFFVKNCNIYVQHMKQNHRNNSFLLVQIQGFFVRGLNTTYFLNFFHNV